MMSRPTVHPVDTPMTNDEAGAAVAAVPRVRMKDFQGMAGTPGGLFLRLCQFGFAVVSLCVMATTSDFPSVTAFSYLVAAVSLQSLWSLLLAVADIYALLVRRSFRNAGLVSLFTIGDGCNFCRGVLTFHKFLEETSRWLLHSLCLKLRPLLHLLLLVHLLVSQSSSEMILINAA